MTKPSVKKPTLKQLLAEGMRLSNKAKAINAAPSAGADERSGALPGHGQEAPEDNRAQKKFAAKLAKGLPLTPGIMLRKIGPRYEIVLELASYSVHLRSLEVLFPTAVEQRQTLERWGEPLEAERLRWVEAFARLGASHEQQGQQEWRSQEWHKVTLDLDTSEDLVQLLQSTAEHLFEQAQRSSARAQTYSALVAQKPYHEMMPARERLRAITILSAPTNSGKTYTACKRLAARLERDPRATVAALLPLRALALQTKDDFMSWGVACSLITGEEREFEPAARALAMTTETLDVSEYFDTVFIDECQLAFDPQRGPAYVRAILGARCRNLILAVAPEQEQALRDVIERVLQEPVQVERLARLCPLSHEPPVMLQSVRRGDLVVAFSARDVHDLAASLTQLGHRVGVIYGRMSPAARRAMVRMYRDNGYDVMVATDAIGMGLSTPARRVIFAAGSKFDGHSFRPLKDSEVRQIAGRAGRFGFNEEGFAALLADGETSGLSNFRLKTILTSRPKPAQAPDSLQVAPDVHAMLAATGMSLSNALLAWKRAVLAHPGYRLGNTTWDDLLYKATILDQVGAGQGLSREQLTRALFVTYPDVDRERDWHSLFRSYVEAIKHRREVPLPRLGGDLARLESLAIHLTMLSQFQRIAPPIFPPEADIAEAQEETGEAIAELLRQRYAQGRTRTHSRSKKGAKRRRKDNRRQRLANYI